MSQRPAAGAFNGLPRPKLRNTIPPSENRLPQGQNYQAAHILSIKNGKHRRVKKKEGCCRGTGKQPCTSTTGCLRGLGDTPVAILNAWRCGVVPGHLLTRQRLLQFLEQSLVRRFIAKPLLAASD